MKPLTLQEACIALAIDSATLWRWCKQAHISPAQDIYDKRRRTLSAMQVQRLAELHHISLAVTQEKQELSLDEVLHRLDAISHRLDVLEERIGHLEGIVGAFKPRTPPTSRALSQTSSASSLSHRGVSSEIIWLTPELVAWRSFCRVHGISEGTIHKAIESGRIPVVRGSWRIGKTSYNLAFNHEGRQKIYELYHSNPRFSACSRCPHEKG